MQTMSKFIATGDPVANLSKKIEALKGDKPKPKKAAAEIKKRKKRKDALTPLKSVDGWQELKEKAHMAFGHRCMCCGKVPKSIGLVHVDHIKPRSIYPELTLCFDNLQVLCMACNFKKGKSETDYRHNFNGQPEFI